MELYLIKSASILLALFLFYKVVLENTSAHTFKRFYLLGSVALAFAIPFVTFTTYIEVPAVTQTVVHFQLQYIESNAQAPIETTNYLPYLLMTLYGLGVLYFLSRFIININYFRVKINRSQHQQNDNVVYALLDEKTTPHTFLKYIFLEKEPFVNKQIPQAILTHEETHAKEKHSLDILFLEVVQIVFWFNPLFYFIKKSCKLNHEFLADHAVLSQGTSTAMYQQLLLSFSTPKSTPALANSINYPSFKKRFTLMKTQTSHKTILLRSILVLPLLAALTYSCGEHTTEYVQEVAMVSEAPEMKIIDLNILENNQLEYNQTKISIEQLPQIIEKENYTTVALDVSPLVEIPFAKTVVAALVELGVANKMSVCSHLENGKNLTTADFNEIMSPLHDLYKKDKTVQEYKKSISVRVEGEEIYLEGNKVALSSFANALDTHTKNWSKADYTEAHPLIIIKNSPKAYLDKIDAEFRKTNYSKANGGMNIVPPPPPAPPKVKKGEKSNIPPPPPNPPKVKKGQSSNIPPPPPQPSVPPIVSTSPLDQVVRLAKENAAFTYEDESISSDKAIALIKQNPSLYILTRRFKNSNPIVDITQDKVIFIENANGWKAPNDMSPSESPEKDPASVLEPYIKKNAAFFIDKKSATPEEAKKLMRSDRAANLKIRTTKEGKTIVTIQGC